MNELWVGLPPAPVGTPTPGELGHPRRPVSPPVGAIKLTLDVEEPPAPRDTPQLAFATINELDARSRYQRRHGTRNEDLTGTGQGRHPRTDVNGHPGDVVAPGLDLASVDPGSHINAETLQGFSDGQGALDGPTGTVKGGHETVSDGLHLSAPEAFDLGTHALVVTVQQVPPAFVPELSGLVGRTNDVREQHCGQNSLCS